MILLSTAQAKRLEAEGKKEEAESAALLARHLNIAGLITAILSSVFIIVIIFVFIIVVAVN